MKRFVFPVFVAVAILGGCNIPYSDGSRVGIVNKISKKGLFCKTWEGEMSLLGGGMRNQTNYNKDGSSYNTPISNVWQFSIENDQIASQVVKAMESGKPIRLEYKEIIIRPPCSAETSYNITGVVELK